MSLQPTHLPQHWSSHVKSGILHAISLASVALSYARGRATGERRLQAELDRAQDEIAMLREELGIKDVRWQRSRPHRRPHYDATQRMRILQLRAARGWTLETTARVFLIDGQTMLAWMSQLDDPDGRPQIKTVEPVNKYPDFVRCLVQQLKTLYPTMGSMRIAQTLAREGLRLGSTTIRRIVREKNRTKPGAPAVAFVRRRRAVGRYPGHTWHLDLTAVPIRAGHWVPWLPLFLPQRWPFCWCVAVLVDQVSRVLVGFAVFHAPPDSKQIQDFLERAIQASGRPPSNVVTDSGTQFSCRSFRRWCKRRGIRPRYGVLGEPFSICIIESFIRSLKQECTRRLTLVPLSHGAMRRELGAYALWYNRSRPHMHLGGRTPDEAFFGRPAPRQRFETRPRMPNRGIPRCRSLELVVGHLGNRSHLPVVELRRAA
jgi:transposase InsO family protein